MEAASGTSGGGKRKMKVRSESTSGFYSSDLESRIEIILIRMDFSSNKPAAQAADADP